MRLLLLLAAFLTALPPIVSAGAFRAAVVKVDITPKSTQWLLGYEARQSTGILDSLHHRVLAIDDGKTAFFLVSSDLALVSPAFYDEVCVRLQRETGISKQQFWWTFTHTHSAPEVGPAGLPRLFMGRRYEHDFDREYAELVTRTLIDAVRQARAALAPARYGVGTGTAFANINRRARDVGGKISLGLNPDGPVDRQIGLIRIEHPDGTPVALVANYAMHGTVLGGKNLLISGDAQAAVANYVEARTGAPMLYINGAAGDIAPIYSGYPDAASGHLGQFRVLLGDRILEASQRMTAKLDQADLWLGDLNVEMPRKSGLGWLDDLKAYAKEDPAGQPRVLLPLRFLRLNRDTVLWAAPLELFCQMALEARRRSPFPNTFFAGYANGWLGYLPTEAAYPEGGYETTVTPFGPEGERTFTEAVVRFLDGIPR